MKTSDNVPGGGDMMLDNVRAPKPTQTYLLGRLNVNFKAPFVQVSTHCPHNMHSEFSIESCCTIVETDRLIGHLLSQDLQLLQLSLIEQTRRDGMGKIDLIFEPMTINGAIQQT